MGWPALVSRVQAWGSAEWPFEGPCQRNGQSREQGKDDSCNEIRVLRYDVSFRDIACGDETRP